MPVISTELQTGNAEQAGDATQEFLRIGPIPINKIHESENFTVVNAYQGPIKQLELKHKVTGEPIGYYERESSKLWFLFLYLDKDPSLLATAINDCGAQKEYRYVRREEDIHTTEILNEAAILKVRRDRLRPLDELLSQIR